MDRRTTNEGFKTNLGSTQNNRNVNWLNVDVMSVGAILSSAYKTTLVVEIVPLVLTRVKIIATVPEMVC